MNEVVKQPMGPSLPGIKQVLLTFNEGNFLPFSAYGRTIDTHVSQVQLPFLPKGLIIWGATGDTLVHGVKVGNMSEVEISGLAPIPGRYFEQGLSFADVERLAESGELDLNLAARQQLDMSEAAPGTQISVAISGPYDRFVVWGTTYARYDGPHRLATVAQLDNSTMFSGRLDEVRLSGLQTLLNVTAPSAEVAAQLLVGLAGYRGSW